MKPFFVSLIVFLMGSYVYAQDLIVLRDGNIIESKVTEISASEIRYKRFDNLNGPTIVIAKAEVLSIRYENRSVEVITPVAPTGQQGNPANKTITPAGQRRPPKPQTALDPDELTVAINANPAGLLAYGSSVCLELGKGHFNSEINLIFPFGLAGRKGAGGGFGGLATFNYFWHTSNGGFYLGGGIGYIFQKNYYYGYVFDGWDSDNGQSIYRTDYFNSHLLTWGLNLGYKFVLSSGLYFRTGAFLGAGFDFGARNIIKEITSGGWSYHSRWSFYAKPDLTIGYVF